MDLRKVIVLLASIAPTSSPAMAAAAQAVEQEAKQHAQTSGQVVDEHGDPIEDAAVWIAPLSKPRDVAKMLKQATVRTGADGRFVLDHAIDRSGRQIVAAAHGRQSCATWLQGNRSGNAEIAPFVLPPGADLIGRVQDADGVPLTDVHVWVTSAVTAANGSPHRMQSNTRSDAGVFRVPCVARTGLRLTLFKLGYVPEVRIVSHESPLSITMRAASIVRGRLVEADGTPITDASLTVQQERITGMPYLPRTCDADGSFALTAPPAPARYRVQAQRTSPSAGRLISTLLRGSQQLTLDDFITADRPTQSVVVHVVDAKTGKRISDFRAAMSRSDLTDDLPGALFFADSDFISYRSEAVIPVMSPERAGILVRADGYAFGAEPVPEEGSGPLVLKLQPESVLRGRVVDRDGKPVAGATVRALPDGDARGSTSSSNLAARWPRTDAQGNYRIGGLRAGAVQVQAYPSDRSGCKPFRTTVTPERETKLDLTVSNRRILTLEVSGDIPAGPAPVVRLRYHQPNRQAEGYQQGLARPSLVSLRRGTRSYAASVQQTDEASLEVFIPSRTRVGVGTILPFERAKIRDAKRQLALPDLNMTILRGRIEVDTRLPTARIAIVATPADAKENRRQFGTRKIHAGVHADGSFAIDMPAGAYALQLVDVETQIVFHTEAHDIQADAKDLVLRPTLRWLNVCLQCEDPEQPATFQAFEVRIERPRGGACDAMAIRSRTRKGFDQALVKPVTRASTMRWLVPSGELEITARQALRTLDGMHGRFSTQRAATEALQITGSEQSVTLTVAAPLSDKALEGPPK